MNTKFESTYAMIVRSEEHSRNALEFATYFVCILTAIIGILQFAHTPVKVTAPGLQGHITSAVVADDDEQS